jgi:hypothetical protein
MLFDNDNQKALILQVIDNTQMNGPLNQTVQAVQVLMQLRQEVQNAKVGVCCDSEPQGPPVSAAKS